MSDDKAPPPPPPMGEQISYDFDTWYCSDPTAQYKLLAIVNVLCIIILMFLFTITGSLADRSGMDFFSEMLWMSFGQLYDGVGGSPDGGLWGTRMVMLVNTFMGMFVFGLVCAFIEEAIDAKLDSLRRGKTKVLEEGFDLIIGWNPRILPLVEQLCLANESDGGGVVVILAEMDKPEMDDFWMGEMDADKRMGTKIITRQGQAIEIFNLNKCSVQKANSITILAPKPHSSDESDAQVTRIMLALTGKLGCPGDCINGINGHVVVELCDVDNMPYVALAIPDDAVCQGYPEDYPDHIDVPDPRPRGPHGSRVKNFYVKPMVSHDLTGRLMIQCALQPGLARVFAHILAFSDNEFYFKCFESLSRRRFADVCFLLDDAIPFGIHLKNPLILKTKDGDAGRLVKIMINPPGDQTLDPDDEIIVIAEDDDSFEPNQKGFNWVDPKDVPDFEEPKPEPANMLIIGFRRDLDDMINEIDKWVSPGSKLTSFAIADPGERMQILLDGGLNPEFENLALFNLQGNPVVLRHLEEKIDIPSFTSIIVLTESVDADNNPLTPLNCDSRTLVTVLLIRNILENTPGAKGALVCEILDPRTEKLLELAKLDDFLSSNDLVSMALAQVAKESDIHGLLETIFSPEGDEMHIKDIRLYAYEQEQLSWWEITARARMRGEVAMGFMKAEYGDGIPILNPGNNSQKWAYPGNKHTRLTWKYPDQLIVFSED